MGHALRLDSPAKVNLVLEIVGKREDGYHELRTIFQKIDLHDTLRFSLQREKGIRIATNHASLPTGRGNLVYRAAEAMFARSGYDGGVSIRIQKRIPLGAGLGGGSSNAATTLKALNGLLKAGLGRRDLMALGLSLGADVPFFFMKGSAVGTGIGERLRQTTLPELWFVLIYPNFEVSTRWAYENFVLTKNRFQYKIHKFLKTREGVSRALRKDLEAVVSARHPQIQVMKEMLYAAGALGALMTGSGPTVFGIYADEGGASEGYQKIKRMVRGKPWVVLRANSISV